MEATYPRGGEPLVNAFAKKPRPQPVILSRDQEERVIITTRLPGSTRHFSPPPVPKQIDVYEPSGSDPMNTDWGFGRRENSYNRLIETAVQARWRDSDRPLPPLLFKALIATESGFDPRARSAAGAVGLVQLMPGTARAHGLKLTPRDERLVPEKAVPVGVAVLAEKHGFILQPPATTAWGRRVREHYDQHGRPPGAELWKMSLAGYNGGASTVVRAMAYAIESGADPLVWSNLVGEAAEPSQTPLYRAVADVFGERRAAAKYREMASYPGRIFGYYGTT